MKFRDTFEETIMVSYVKPKSYLLDILGKNCPLK